MNARRALWTAICAAGALSCSSSVSAVAFETHSFSSSFSGSGANALSDPQGLGIDQSTGEVYVVDSANDRVEIFGASGAFVSAFGTAGSGNDEFKEPSQIAIDNSGPLPGNVYVLDGGNERVEIFNAKGEYQSQVTAADLAATKPSQPVGTLQGIAVDAAGDLWVYDSHANMYEFPKGSLLGRFGFNPGAEVSPGLAIDPSGDFYVLFATPNVFKLGPSGEQLGYVDGCGCATAVAVDPANGDIYVDRKTSVAHYLATGSFNDSFGSSPPGALVNGSGIAVNGSAGSVYVADDSTSKVDVFVAITLPDVTTEAPTAVAKASAVLHGVVNPDGIPVTSCEFEWGTEPGVYSHTAACSPAPGSGNAPVAVSAQLTGLAPGTAFYYRLVASNANGANRGAEEAFATPPAVEALSTGPAEGISPEGAKLTGSLAPDGVDAHYYFQYGTTEAYGSTSPAPPGIDAGDASESVTVKTTLAGLTANTTYHYRLVGVDSFGTTLGGDATFTTAGPPTVDTESSEGVGYARAALQAQITPDGRETTYQFEYGETSSYGTNVPSSPTAIAGSGEEPVSVPAAELAGLKIGTTYHYRVIASNEYGTVDGPDHTFTTLSAATPLVDSEYVTNVAGTSALLQAQVDPRGTETTAYFQYGTASCAGSPASCADVPVAPGSSIGSGETDAPVTAHPEGLTPGATYHYRVVAVNALGTVYGPDQTFITQQSPAEAFTLPDGRQYELVSPPSKDGAEVLGIAGGGQTPTGGGPTQASEDGSSVTYVTDSPVSSSAPTNTYSTQLLSMRGAGGWSSQDISPPHENAAGLDLNQGEEYRAFSSDLSHAVLEPHYHAPQPPLAPELHQKLIKERTEIYLRNDATGVFQALLTDEPLPEVSFEGATPDLKDVLFNTGASLDPRYPGASGLYEWSDGHAQLVSVLPKGEPAAGGSLAGPRDAISADGEHVIWAGSGGLFTRDTETGVTVQVDAPQGGGSPGGGGGLLAASKDGSRIFFNDQLELTPGATEGGVYLYDLADGKLTDLTPGTGPGHLEPETNPEAEIHALFTSFGANEDGTSLYEVTSLALTNVPNSAGETAKETGGAANLYLLHEAPVGSGSWRTVFIAGLSSADRFGYFHQHHQFDEGSLVAQSARVAPGGQYLAFMSNKSLTGYDNRDASSGQPDEEVYLYSAASNKLVCASCNPTGARPTGEFDTGEYPQMPMDPNNIWEHDWLAAAIPGWTPFGTDSSTEYQPRYLSDSGRLFFDSADALVPQDVNGEEDVYEYEPAGVGGCAGTVGCVSLISSGLGAEASTFFDASATGGDVFFKTEDWLVPQDKDGVFDLYDARVCTSAAPCPAELALAPPCTTADSCRPAPSPQPGVFSAPASATFSGSGNPSAAVVKAVMPKATKKTAARVRAAKLAKALKVCRAKPKARRKRCEARARRRYGKAKSGRGVK
jgi:phosphodiesterase/alkaline phosphatase D-like protein